MYQLYGLLLGTALVLSAPFYLWKGRGTRKYLHSYRERLGRLPDTLPAATRPSVWVHAVSVGEVIAARPLLFALKRRFPERALYLSTTTVTGHALAQRGGLGVDGLFFVPFDLPRPVRAALDRVRPALLVLVETELWPNLIHEARRRGARIAVVNGRISPRSFPRYRALRPLLARVLADVDLFLMQSEPHAERARAIGAPAKRVRVLGNLKYDAQPETRPESDLARILGPADSARPLWVAGSTVAGEEEHVLRGYETLAARFAGLRLVLAPRHPERFAAVAAMARARGLTVALRTELRAEPFSGDVLVLDTIGELAGLYPMATVVFVGGSLVPAGGHNVLEPAAAGRPVVVGPHMANFAEIAREFVAEGALVQVSDGAALLEETGALLADAERREATARRATAILERNRGAVERTAAALGELVA